MAGQDRKKPGEIALKIGVVGAIGVGAVLSGLFISRRGRNLIREVWQGRRRSRIEDRVLDTLWGDPVIGRRVIDARESPEGTVVLTGTVRSDGERRVALALASGVEGVHGVVDQLTVQPRTRVSGLRRRVDAN